MRGVILLPLMMLATPAPAQRYLSGPGVALERVLPPAPKIGSVEDEADRASFRATRALEGSARWLQAIGDADEAIPAMLADFTAAAGRPLSPTATPALAHLLTRMRSDVSAGVNAVKPVYARRRPFLVDAGPVCQRRAMLANSFDYPSGHTSWGTAVAIVLAELVPARATELLARGRDYGDSRVICGAHNASAVAAGRQAGAAMVARLHGDSGFRTDLDAARRELDPALAVMPRIAAPRAAPLLGNCGNNRASQVRVYRSRPTDCTDCELKPQCAIGKKRGVTRLVSEDAGDAVPALAGTDAYVKVRRRNQRIERVFGHL